MDALLGHSPAMNATRLVFVVITIVLLGVGWMAIHRKEKPIQRSRARER